MAGRGPQTFQKRQKEQQRKEKQAEKAARREQRKIDKANGIITPDEDENDDDLLIKEAVARHLENQSAS